MGWGGREVCVFGRSQTAGLSPDHQPQHTRQPKPLDKQIKVMVAGGSSMPLVLEDFFDMIRTPVIVGYGMTVRL